jgi:hypothetical protein
MMENEQENTINRPKPMHRIPQLAHYLCKSRHLKVEGNGGGGGMCGLLSFQTETWERSTVDMPEKLIPKLCRALRSVHLE